jgi:pimeloyl-ACP methyl ester carboxylesterase
MLRLFVVATVYLTMTACQKAASWSDHAAHKSGFVTANGIRLHYLDWGGSGPALILIHGFQENPHIFDDLAPAFTDRFRVVAYARRGHGESVAKAPCDTATLTADLLGLMDGLGIAKADLAGWSMGGNEITAMAGGHPDRVGRIVYLDGTYDWGDPAFATAFQNLPPRYQSLPAGVMASLDAWREFERDLWFPAVRDISRLEAYIRGTVGPAGRVGASGHERQRLAGVGRSSVCGAQGLLQGPLSGSCHLCRESAASARRGSGVRGCKPRVGTEVHGTLPGCIP